MALRSYLINSLPTGDDYTALISSLLGSQLMILNDFSKSSSSIITADSELCERIGRGFAGFGFSEEELPKLEDPSALVVFSSEENRPSESEVPLAKVFDGIYNLLAGHNARLYICILKTDPEHLHLVRERVEEALSMGEIRVTKSSGGRGPSSHSLQSDLFYGSGERRTLSGLLNMLNEISSVNAPPYKMLLVIDGEKELITSCLSSRLLLLNSFPLKVKSLPEMYGAVCKIDAMPFSHAALARLLIFSDAIQRVPKIRTAHPRQILEGIEVGKFLEDSVSESASTIRIEKSTLNLGAIITGLPGTGKTFAAMSLLSKIGSADGATSIVVISPTKEWGEFARLRNINLIKIYGSPTPINFFRCASERLKDKFSENLAMLIASASSAGPYQSSMEKCLLAAFRRVYSKELCPDPVYLYNQIEEVLIDQHAKRSNTGIKYTKHGENIRAALENLRLILFRPEFASTTGIDLEEAFRKGVVFDLSDVSSRMKQFFYALILNQLYAFLDTFDEKGNEKLRIEIALEEAQLIFSPDEISPVVTDLRERIQDFRKKGIGLMLITHSITDITPSIRRLCQSKFYFRQSADVAKYALSDLGIDATDAQALGRIRSLEQGCCALLYLDVQGTERLPKGPLFAKIDGSIDGDQSGIARTAEFPRENLICDCTFALVDEKKNPVVGRKVELAYLGEIIERAITDQNGEVRAKNLIREKEYALVVLGERKKENRTYQIRMSEKITISL